MSPHQNVGIIMFKTR